MSFIGVMGKVSIAQARCGLLPLDEVEEMFGVIDVVSIAQARCGLLPPCKA